MSQYSTNEPTQWMAGGDELKMRKNKVLIRRGHLKPQVCFSFAFCYVIL